MKFIKTELAKKLEETIVDLDFTPRRGTGGSAGFDLRACIEAPVTIFPDQVVKIPTGIKIWIGSENASQVNEDDGWAMAGLLLPRSSSKGLLLNNTIGLIDTDYQGELFVKLRNVTSEAITVQLGEAFAQITFVPVFATNLEQVDSFDTVTERSEGGFGSTNKEQPDPIGR